MATTLERIDQTAEWGALEHHAAEVRDRHLRELFAADPATWMIGKGNRGRCFGSD